MIDHDRHLDDLQLLSADHGERFFAGVVAAIRASAESSLPPTIEPWQSFVVDLGFDSVAVAILAVELEEQFGVPVLLDTWVAESADPDQLTVASLCAYLSSRLGDVIARDQ
jgi:acyl carrier protein